MAWTERTALLLGEDGVARLEKASVLVFGVGGVGGYAVEALARAGVGALTLVDADAVAESNLNRQIIATCDVLGEPKAEAAKRRVLSINPACRVTALQMFYLPENADELPLVGYDYIVDAIDTMSAKLELITRAWALGVPVISAMGCGNKLDATAFRVGDLYETTMDPLARVMRHELRRRGVTALRVVYSTERPRAALVQDANNAAHGRHAPGSISYVPAAAGLILAGEVIKTISGV